MAQPRNLDPKVWGPRVWQTLHTLAFNYPDQPNLEQQKSARALLDSLRNLLPCAKCRRHYNEYLDQHTIDEAVKSRTGLTNYLYTFHNDVNARLGRPPFPVQQAERIYGEAEQIQTQVNWSWLFIGLLVGALLVLAAQALTSKPMRNSLRRFAVQ